MLLMLTPPVPLSAPLLQTSHWIVSAMCGVTAVVLIVRCQDHYSVDIVLGAGVAWLLCTNPGQCPACLEPLVLRRHASNIFLTLLQHPRFPLSPRALGRALGGREPAPGGGTGGVCTRRNQGPLGR